MGSFLSDWLVSLPRVLRRTPVLTGALLVLFCSLLPAWAAEPVKGIYGIPPVSRDAFKPPQNLITNPGFATDPGTGLPRGWTPAAKKDTQSRFILRSSDTFALRPDAPFPPFRAIGITAGWDRSGTWQSPLPPCEPGKRYVFNARFYREHWENRVYPEIELWGQHYLLNTHWRTRVFQPLTVHLVCPEEAGDGMFRFSNHHPRHTFWMAQPSLRPEQTAEPAWEEPKPEAEPDFFPIGVYGAGLEDLQSVKELALNTVLVNGKADNLETVLAACHRLGLRYMIAVPRDPDRLPIFLDRLDGQVKPDRLSFYVNDEPGIQSFPIHRAEDIYRLLKERYPRAPAAMAVVRPQVVRDFRHATDLFMLDQYPVPYMPMTWLSDALEEAAAHASRNQVAAVVQAFGGKRWADVGWPRLPTWQEMNCLAFLSVVHGGRAVFFYTFKEIGKSAQGREALGQVVGRLNRLYPWLTQKTHPVNVAMTSANRVDPKGRPAVHACVKKKGRDTLLLAVNTLGTYVEAVFDWSPDPDQPETTCQEVFSGQPCTIQGERLYARFDPFEAKAFLRQRLPHGALK